MCRLLALSSNGDVYTSIRISLTLGCYMSFHIFPMDIQTCPIELESFGYSMETLQFNWQAKNAIQLNPYIVLPQFEIKGFKLQDCTKHYATGKCESLKMRDIFSKDVKTHVFSGSSS